MVRRLCPGDGASTLYHEGRYVTVIALGGGTVSLVVGASLRLLSLRPEVTPDPTDPTEQEPGPTDPTFRNQEAMREDSVYGERKDRHQAILLMDASALHDRFPWSAKLVFNESMMKSELDEKKIKEEGGAPKTSTILGDKDGEVHRWVIGNEAGEILPKFLLAKFITIESGKVFGRPTSIVTGDEERDRLFAIVREAQLRGVQPLAQKEAKKAKRGTSKASTRKAAKKEKHTAAEEEEEDGEVCD